jgi:hypothetical protein
VIYSWTTFGAAGTDAFITDTLSESGLRNEMSWVNCEKEVGAAIRYGRITIERAHTRAYSAL